MNGDVDAMDVDAKKRRYPFFLISKYACGVRTSLHNKRHSKRGQDRPRFAQKSKVVFVVHQAQPPLAHLVHVANINLISKLLEGVRFHN